MYNTNSNLLYEETQSASAVLPVSGIERIYFSPQKSKCNQAAFKEFGKGANDSVKALIPIRLIILRRCTEVIRYRNIYATVVRSFQI